MDTNQVILEGEPPPPYTSIENGNNLSNTTTHDINTTVDQYNARDQTVNPTQVLQTRQQELQESPPEYQQSQPKYYHQAPVVYPCPVNRDATVPHRQTGQLVSIPPHCSSVGGLNQHARPEYVPREHPNWPLQLRFPFAVVSRQPPQSFAEMQNPNVLDTEQLIDREDPDDNCFLAWVACVLCCWPIGIPAIITSNRARHASKRGEHLIAYKYGKLSSQLSWCAIVVGCLFYLMIIFIVLRILKTI